MVGPLQRVRDRDERARRRHTTGKPPDRLLRDATYRGRPAGILWLTVGLPEKVWLESLKPVAVGLKEAPVAELVYDQGVGETQHQRGIGVRSRRQPFGIHKIGRVVSQGTHVNESHAVGSTPLQPVEGGVLAGAARADLGVLGGHAAEHHDEPGVLGDHRPDRLFLCEGKVAPSENVRDDDLTGGGTVGVDRADVSADLVEEPVNLALGVVEAARRRPAIRSSEDGLVSVGFFYPLKFLGNEIKGTVPAHRDERLDATASPPTLGSVFQPSAADHGLCDPGLVVDRGGDGLADR